MVSRIGALALALALPIVATTLGTIASADAAPAAASSASSAANCRTVSGPFHGRGASILDARNRRYVPYGIGVPGLSNNNVSAWTVQRDKQQIAAARNTWCANTVRLQVSQYQLIKGAGYRSRDLQVNTAFLNHVKDEVAYARSLGLMVVVNLQTQSDRDYDDVLNMPTTRSYFFWKTMTTTFGADRNVVFDLFNEPGQVGTWDRWRNGFTQKGVRYFGFQELAKIVRAAGSKNIFWIEGVQRAGTLIRAWRYRMYHVGLVAYAEHRPPAPNTVATWRSNFGYLAERNLAPVVVGEWAQYARTNAYWACWDNAPVAVPRWLAYLGAHQIGMVAQKLDAGQLLQSKNFSDPSRIKSNWRCRTGLNQGAGTLIQSWFFRHNWVPSA